MGAVTFPEPAVAAFLDAHIVPLRLAHNHVPLARQFEIRWTPTLILLDEEGKEHHRTVGFLSPEELLANLLLGTAKLHFDLEDFKKALDRLQDLLARYPRSGAAPEALFLRGVSGYKHTHNPAPLKEAYEALQAAYPQSEWAKRSEPYRLL